MSRTVFLYLVRLFALYFVAIFAVVWVVFLIADFGDRVKMFVEHQWIDVAELYGNKALVAALQLGPAAMLLAAGAGISTLRKRGELTAMRSLTFGASALYLPIAICTVLGSTVLIAFDEYLVTTAGQRVDEITVTKFNRWGDWRFYYSPKQWFRVGDRVLHLRRGDVENGFEEVTVLNLTPGFTLRSRIDAARMDHQGGTTWKLTGATERTFDGHTSETISLGTVVSDLGVGRRDLQIRQGRPEQMRVAQLLEQIEARGRVGLPTRQFQLALHNRFAYPLTGMAAALLAVGLALRAGRRGHLTVALMEGFVVAVALWGMMVVAKSLVLSERLPPAMAAWMPFAVLIAVAGVLWFRQEGWLSRVGARA